MFNLLAVLGIAGAIEATELDSQVLPRDFPVMLALTIALFLMARGKSGGGHINRVEAGLLLVTYGGYMVWLYLSETKVI